MRVIKGIGLVLFLHHEVEGGEEPEPLSEEGKFFVRYLVPGLLGGLFKRKVGVSDVVI